MESSNKVSKTSGVRYLKQYPVNEPPPADFPKRDPNMCRYGYVKDGNWIHIEIPDPFDKWNPLRDLQFQDPEINK
ncbi:MAG: hypothetical protein JNL11_06095 [Bdellovibrionaceae bacterium]|nr:hypothetical protein [Pseudobdellovibrionaceae bacterium]